MRKLPAKFVEGWAKDAAIYRTARKVHNCRGNGSHRDQHSDACTRVIGVGDPYIEYVGEASPYQAGTAHSIACALSYAFIRSAPMRKHKPAPTLTAAIEWIAYNDDSVFVRDEDLDEVAGQTSVVLIADLFGVDTQKIARRILTLRQART